jgi:hypothetical protein
MGYLDMEARKKYLVEWRKKNRPRLREYFRNYIIRTGRVRKTNESERKIHDIRTRGVGREYEKIALSMLPDSKDMNEPIQNSPYDINWNGLKIDVKMRTADRRDYYLFSRRLKSKIDFFLCFCVKNGNIKHIFLIPELVFGRFVSITPNSLNKYKQYRVYTN